MANRDQDWFLQAVRNLEQARDSMGAQRHEWACFAAQQPAERAVKALHLHDGQEAWGHVVARLLRELPPKFGVDEAMVDQARVLDAYYIAPRYANGHPEGPPFMYYGKLQSGEAIRYAGAILEFVRSQMA